MHHDVPGSAFTINRRLQLVNSAVAFALALLISITVHEFGHAVAALSLGFSPVVHPFSVDPNVATDHQHLITVLTGPAVSLLLGAVALLVAVRGGFLRLLGLWLGLISLQTGIGYLVTGPFPNAGDISSAINYADAPSWVGWAAFVIGAIGTAAVGWLATKRLVVLCDPADELGPQMRALGLFAWLVGTGATLILSIGAFDFSAAGFFEVFGVLAAGVFLTFVRLYLRWIPTAEANRQPLRLTWPVAGLVAVVIVAALRLIVLGPGLTL